ncbi:MAG TPA: carboxypeptidase-like regulatory domain-containing protein, partial [Edaphobacter sp.]|nr:carboxypeptidase-like regulatory domain-containing protein [Edaphobacter sp.]
MHYLVRRSSLVVWAVCVFVVLLVSSPIPGLAAEQGSLHGTISDPLGAIVAGAKVELLNGTTVVKTTTTDGAGNYAFDVSQNARYRVRAVAPTFQSSTSDSVYITKSTRAELDVTLATQTLTQQVSVTASATP